MYSLQWFNISYEIFFYILSLFVITCYAQTANVKKDGFKWQPYAEYGRNGDHSTQTVPFVALK